MSTLLSPLERWWKVEELLMHDSLVFEMCPFLMGSSLARFRNVTIGSCNLEIVSSIVREGTPLTSVASALLANAGRDLTCIVDPDTSEPDE